MTRGGFHRKDGWTSQETINLQDHYTFSEQNKVERLLPNRTWKAIRRKAKKVGLYRGNYIPPLERLPTFNPDTYIKTWLGCAIDCEGTIGLYYRKSTDNYLPHVSFCNTNIKLVETFKQYSFKENKINGYHREPHKTKYDYNINKMPYVYTFLREIEPFLIAKKEQAILVMSWIELEDQRLKEHRKYGYGYTPEQIEIFRRVKRLNKRGVE